MAEAARSESNGAAVPQPEALDAYFASFEVGVDPFHRAERVPVIASHAEATRYSAQALAHRIRGPEAEVGDDLPLDFRVPDGRGGMRWQRLHPDVFVSFGVAHDPTRREYDAEKLGAPGFVLEVLSRSTWQRDMGSKREVYDAMGVREYFVFDPTGELPVAPPIQGFALARGGRRLPETTLPNAAMGVRSEVLGLVAYMPGERVASTDDRAGALPLRGHDLETCADLPTYGDHAVARWRRRTAGVGRFAQFPCVTRTLRLRPRAGHIVHRVGLAAIGSQGWPSSPCVRSPRNDDEAGVILPESVDVSDVQTLFISSVSESNAATVLSVGRIENNSQNTSVQTGW